MGYRLWHGVLLMSDVYSVTGKVEAKDGRLGTILGEDGVDSCELATGYWAVSLGKLAGSGYHISKSSISGPSIARVTVL
jgi:hypothetical protein